MHDWKALRHRGDEGIIKVCVGENRKGASRVTSAARSVSRLRASRWLHLAEVSRPLAKPHRLSWPAVDCGMEKRTG